MIILGVFNGHDAGAALFDEYRMISAVALERVTRRVVNAQVTPQFFNTSTAAEAERGSRPAATATINNNRV